MGLRAWIYYFKHALQSILGNRLIHIISMGTIYISLLFLGLFILLAINVNRWVAQWGESVSMSVYLKDGIDQKTEDKIKSTLSNLKGAEVTGALGQRL